MAVPIWSNGASAPDTWQSVRQVFIIIRKLIIIITKVLLLKYVLFLKLLFDDKLKKLLWFWLHVPFSGYFHHITKFPEEFFSSNCTVSVQNSEAMELMEVMLLGQVIGVNIIIIYGLLDNKGLIQEFAQVRVNPQHLYWHSLTHFHIEFSEVQLDFVLATNKNEQL